MEVAFPCETVLYIEIILLAVHLNVYFILSIEAGNCTGNACVFMAIFFYTVIFDNLINTDFSSYMNRKSDFWGGECCIIVYSYDINLPCQTLFHPWVQGGHYKLFRMKLILTLQMSANWLHWIRGKEFNLGSASCWFNPWQIHT